MDLHALVDRDIALTERALGKAKIAVPERSHLRKVAEDFVTMARSYYADAKHFRDAGELDKALANVNYAHGWLDAGARIGLFEVGCDDQRLTLRGWLCEECVYVVVLAYVEWHVVEFSG